ncbi:MAG TPA: hypothetical protein VLX85_04600 [Stellaceae bacterium]|nr:hypothetical protein [Stellaceae bacterium]
MVANLSLVASAAATSRISSTRFSPRVPRRQEANPAAERPGWKRFPPAAEWPKKNAVAAAPVDEKTLREILVKFLDERGKAAGAQALSVQEKDELFDQLSR